MMTDEAEKGYDSFLGEPKIVEKSFLPSMDLGGAEAFFRKNARLLGLINVKGEVEQVILGYTPVALFKLNKTANFSTNSSRRIREWDNLFHVDLNNFDLYYCYRNPVTSSPSVKSLSFLRQVVDLPSDAWGVLSVFLDLGEVDVGKLGGADEKFFSENSAALDLLVKRGLILVKPDGSGFLSHVRFTSPGDIRYNLLSFLGVSDSIETRDFVAPIMRQPREILPVLTSVLACDGFFEEIIYLPFYQCKYRKSDSVYFERKLSAKFTENNG